MNKQLLYHIALTAIPNIGAITAKKLIAYCGSAEAVFSEKKRALEKVPGIGAVNASRIIDYKTEAISVAEHELVFMEKNNINAVCFNDEFFPKRLNHCEDSPIVLFSKGNFDFNTQKVISVVGTRKATDYGKDFCEQLLENLKPHNPLIVSGLAFGIDVCAHKAALKNSLPTIGVTAHGLDRLYPSQHKSVAKEMLGNGGLVTEFLSGTKPDRENFPKRNRVVAGLADAIIVIESSKKGGSLITAELGNSYNRDVFALPGRINDSQSEGCNALIKQNKAHLLHSFKDIEYIMGWESKTKTNNNQTQLFVDLTIEQQQIVDLLKQQDKINIDELALKAKFPMSKTATLLLELEFNNIVKSLPGKMFKLI